MWTMSLLSFDCACISVGMKARPASGIGSRVSTALIHKEIKEKQNWALKFSLFLVRFAVVELPAWSLLPPLGVGKEGAAWAASWPHAFGFRRAYPPNPSVTLMIILVITEEGMWKWETWGWIRVRPSMAFRSPHCSVTWGVLLSTHRAEKPLPLLNLWGQTFCFWKCFSSPSWVGSAKTLCLSCVLPPYK